MQRKLVSWFIALAALALFGGTAMADQKFVAHLDPRQEVPSTASTGDGVCVITLNNAETSITASCTYRGLTSNLQADHIHGNAAPGVNAGILFNFAATGGTSGSFNAGPFAVTPAQVANMRAHLWYVNLHTVNFPGGEIRGQVKQANTVFDLDGDGRTDITVFRQSANAFFTLQSLTNQLEVTSHGSGAGDNWLNITGDFDGDGRGDPLILKVEAGTNILVWVVLQTGSASIRTVRWGNLGGANPDNIAPADYDGDGKQDIGVFRRSEGVWYILESSTGNQRVEPFGAVGDQASVGDYDGDGKADLTVVRTEAGQRVFYIRQSLDGTVRRVPWGASTDGFFLFAPVDVDGDGKQDIMVLRAVSGQRVFLILRSSDNQPVQITHGTTTAPADTFLVGDYDGDGKTDFVARRIVSGQMVWFILQSSNGQIRTVQWGATGDQ
jgi:hypothetical protein